MSHYTKYAGMYYLFAGNLHYICAVNVAAGIYQWQRASHDGSLDSRKHTERLSDIDRYDFHMLTREQLTSGWEEGN